MAPTLLTDISLKSRVWTEEVFGPILPVVGYDSVDEAVALANSSRFGLTASVFGPWEQARQVARQLHAGTVAINDTGIANYVMPSLPWQGVGSSGPGVSHGPEAILAATYAKIESLNLLYALPLFRKQPWHFAKTPKNDDLSLTHQLIGSFANESWLAKCSPRFLWTVWQHRSNTRL
jgi:delta 1-pyrroline-5-carboxylate dehydrogenase